MQVTLTAGRFGWDYILEADNGKTRLVQSDFDYPGVASNLGWSPALVQPEIGCIHDGTDGTVDCACGVKAIDFIQHAHAYLDDHEGESFDDPGYFSDDADDADDQDINPGDVEIQCAHCGARVRDADSWGDGDIGDTSLPSFCSEACYGLGIDSST